MPCSSSDGFVQRDGAEGKGVVELCGKGNSNSTRLLGANDIDSLEAREKVRDRERRC